MSFYKKKQPRQNVTVSANPRPLGSLTPQRQMLVCVAAMHSYVVVLPVLCNTKKKK